MKIVSTPGAPAARGHYSQAVVHAGLVYVAGQLPIVPGAPPAAAGSFDDQVTFAPAVWVAGAACPGSSPASPQALSNASAATVREATRWRRRGCDGRSDGRGTAGSRVDAQGSAA